jgi:hypothetical protein
MTSKKQFQGFINTPALWKDSLVFGMEQFILPELTLNNEIPEFNPKIRLGKLVENFVFEVLNQSSSTELLAENIQIRKEKISIGEIDCILKSLNEFIHLEIVYKFYLFDDQISGSDLHKWVGPNRNDTLVHKLTKLRDKQLPILYKEETKRSLDTLNLDFENILQKVLFKAQLFVPRAKLSDTFPTINNHCIKGFYISYNDLTDLKFDMFYIPSKRDWLTEPNKEVEWLNFEDFNTQITVYFKEERAPLCWLKKSDGTMEKFFVVWW